MNKDQVKHLVVHCAYTPSNMDIGADDIDRWHKEKGWSGCGYHQVIRRNGDVEDGRPMNKAGAHVRGINRVSIGICLAGGMNEAKDGPEFNHTEEQMEALRILLDELLEEYPNADVKGHYQFSTVKTCPNFDAAKWYETNKIEHTY